MVTGYRFVKQRIGRLALCGLLSVLVALILAAMLHAPFGQDARLKQTIELSVAGVSLRTLFQRIQAQTRVSLKADAALADSAVIVHVPNRPLHELMTHLATAFHAEWHADDSQPPAYTLRPLPLTGETPSQRLTRQRLDDLPRRLRALYEPAAGEAAEDEDLQRAIEAYRKTLQKERLPLRLLGQLTPAELDALRAGKTLEFSSRTDPRFEPDWLAEWKSWLEDTIAYQAEMLSTPKGDPVLAQYYADVLGKGIARGDEMRLRVSCDPRTAAIQCAVGLFAQGELIHGETFVPNEDPPDPEGFSWHDFTAVMPKDHPWRDLEFEQRDSEEPERRDRSSVRRVRPPALPPLQGDWFAYEAEVVLRIAQAVGKPFVAEYGWTRRSLAEVYTLPGFAYSLAVSGYEWLVRDGWVIMRYRDPRDARPQRMPKHALQQWFFKPNRRGVLTIQDLMSMARYVQDAEDLYAALAAFGIAHGVVFDGELPSPYVVISELKGLPQVHHGLLYAVSSLEPLYEMPEVFRVLAALSEAQHRALLAGQTIHIETLSPRALDAVLDLAYSRDKARAPSFWQGAPPKGTLRLISREQQVCWLLLPPNRAAKIRDVDSASKLWRELEKRLNYDREALYREYGVELCCVRVYLLEVHIDGSSQAFELLKDHTPLLQRNPFLRTPK